MKSLERQTMLQASAGPANAAKDQIAPCLPKISPELSLPEIVRRQTGGPLLDPSKLQIHAEPPSPELSAEQKEIEELLEKNKDLIQLVRPNLAETFMLRTPTRIQLDFLQKIDSLADDLRTIQMAKVELLSPRANAINRLAELHLRTHAFIRTAVANHLLSGNTSNLPDEIRNPVEELTAQLKYSEHTAAVNEAAETYVTFLARGDGLSYEKKMADFLKGVRRTIEENHGMPLSDLSQVGELERQLAQITGRTQAEFYFPGQMVNLESAVSIVHDALTTEYIIDELSLRHRLGEPGKDIPKWDEVQKSIEADLAGKRNSEREPMVTYIMSRVKGYRDLKSRRDEILRIGEQRAEDSVGWDVYIPLWTATYYWKKELPTTQHDADLPKVQQRNKQYAHFADALKPSLDARSTIFLDKQFQQAVEHEVERRGSWLLDPEKPDYYLPAAAAAYKRFLKEQEVILRAYR